MPPRTCLLPRCFQPMSAPENALLTGLLPPSQDLLGRIAHAWRLIRQVTASMRRPGLDEPGPGPPYPRMQLPLVFLDRPWKLAMGLSALDPADWLWRDEHFAAETPHAGPCWPRRAGTGPGHAARGGAGRAELVAMVRGASRGLAPEPHAGLAALAGLAQEDFCLMQRAAGRAYALTAALLCFPAHWRLAEKLGRPLARSMRRCRVSTSGWRRRRTGSSPTSASSGRSGGRTGRWSRARAIPPAAARAAGGPHGRERRRAALAPGRAADPAPPAAERGGGVHHPHPGPAAGRDRRQPGVAARHGRTAARDGARHGRLQGAARRLRGAAARLSRRPRREQEPARGRQRGAGEGPVLQPQPGSRRA